MMTHTGDQVTLYEAADSGTACLFIIIIIIIRATKHVFLLTKVKKLCFI